ncbi:MAG: hypothetical protein NC818_06220 [Candidatus Omnitrophica bacterium]|nr:hypothetical protein [Candidatus Omnitrophota bacterium]
MQRGERIGIIAGAMGSSLGTMLWLVILGVLIKSVVLIILPLIVVLVSVTGVAKLYSMNPERKLSIIGILITWLIFWNVILLNYYYDKIPQSIGNITTAKSNIPLAEINCMLALFFIIGCVFMVKDIVSLTDRSSSLK